MGFLHYPHHMGMARVAGAVLFMLFLGLNGCATMDRSTDAILPSVQRDLDYLDNIKDTIRFNIDIDPETYCDRQGEILPVVKRDHRISFVLEFPEPIPDYVRVDRFRVEITGYNISIPLSHISETHLVSDIIQADFLHPDTEERLDVPVLYLGQKSKTRLKTGALAADTLAPPPPVDIEVVRRERDLFVVTWSVDSARAHDVSEYFIARYQSGIWSPVWRGHTTRNVTIASPAEGDFRIESFDCAGNRSSTAFSPGILSANGVACGHNSEAAAKTNAEKLFFEKHIRPLIVSNPLNQCHDWMPPMLQYRVDRKPEQLDCRPYVAVIASIDAKVLDRWVEQTAAGLKRRQKYSVLLWTEGPGAEILADYFIKGISPLGYAVHTDTDSLFCGSGHKVNIRVEIEPQGPMPGLPGLESWHVDTSIRIKNNLSGREIRFIARHFDSIDNRIYGREISSAIHGRGPNSYPARVAKPFWDLIADEVFVFFQ